jgi:hypothetical protein
VLGVPLSARCLEILNLALEIDPMLRADPAVGRRVEMQLVFTVAGW